MASRRPRPRRLLLPILLAAVLGGEITGLALARSMAPAAGAGGAVAASASPAVAPAQSAARTGGSVLTSAAIADAARDAVSANVNAARSRTSSAPVGPSAQPANMARSTTSSTKAAAGTGGTSSTAAVASYRGKNRVWIPSLGINRSVSAFPCSRTRPPDNYMYRWGCAGANNVYLLGHAHSVFKPLHDAYVGGRLKKGMKVIYADSAGRVLTYSVIWWRVVAPTTAASWAWAAQSKPSMTLQTCVGAKSQYRLMVRLVQVG